MPGLAKFRQSLCNNPLVKFHLVQHFRHPLQCQLMLSENLSSVPSLAGDDRGRTEKEQIIDGEEKEIRTSPI